VTLCIAAICEHEAEPCIILCADRSGTRGAVSSQDTDKIGQYGKTTVMLAGQLSAAKELLVECEAAIRTYPVGGNDLELDALMQSLRQAVGRRKRRIIDEHLTTSYGLSYSEFLKDARTTFGESQYLHVWDEIRRLDLNSELIISTFSDGEAELLKISQDGKLTWEDHYCTAGTGSSIAHAFLCQRSYIDVIDLPFILHRVFEAKIAAEKNPYVGLETVIELSHFSRDIGIEFPESETMLSKIRNRMGRDPTLYWKNDFVYEISDALKKKRAHGSS
jgi:20S proteasome alpha/beta subunit